MSDRSDHSSSPQSGERTDQTPKSQTGQTQTSSLPLDTAHSRPVPELLTHWQLLEERAAVDIRREVVGQVVLQKRVVEREEVLPVTLRTEYLEISLAPGAGEVRLDGQVLEAGRTHEFVLLQEQAVIHKEIRPALDVQIWKETERREEAVTVHLQHERLEVIDPLGLVRERNSEDVTQAAERPSSAGGAAASCFGADSSVVVGPDTSNKG